jgi:hypothetical protein
MVFPKVKLPATIRTYPCEAGKLLIVVITAVNSNNFL